MGIIISKLKFQKERKILFLGLDGSGKTSILNALQKMSKNKDSTTKENLKNVLLPTVGFNIETLNYQDKNITIWDLSGNKNIRSYWKCYYTNVKGIVFVIDITDVSRKEISFQILEDLLNEQELSNTTMMVLLNKSDLNNLINIEEVNEHLTKINDKKKIKAFKCCVLDAKSIAESFNWFVSEIL